MEDIQKIRDLRAKGLSLREISEKLRTTRKRIEDLVNSSIIQENQEVSKKVSKEIKKVSSSTSAKKAIKKKAPSKRK